MSAALVWKLVGLPLATIGVAYLGLVIFAPFIAQRLLYHPQFGSFRAPAGLKTIPSADGTAIAVLHLPNPDAHFTIWYFHGNAEDLGDLEPMLHGLHEAGYAVLAYDYPGYGQSGGRPSEAALYSTARTVRNYLRRELKVPAAQTLIYGTSLGGGSAIQMATEEKVGGVILQSAFMSAYRVMTRWRLIPFDQFENLPKLAAIFAPLLVIHGQADGTISFHHGEALFAAAHEPKRFLWVPGAGHNDLVEVAGKDYWEALRQFSAVCVSASGAKP